MLYTIHDILHTMSPAQAAAPAPGPGRAPASYRCGSSLAPIYAIYIV